MLICACLRQLFQAALWLSNDTIVVNKDIHKHEQNREVRHEYAVKHYTRPLEYSYMKLLRAQVPIGKHSDNHFHE